MEGRLYTVTFDRVAVTAVQDLFEIQPASNKPVRFAGLKLGQSSDYGDAQDEGLTVRIKRIVATATSGSGGTSPTPRAVHNTSSAAGFTAEVNNTTQATSTGTIEILDQDVFVVRQGLLWLPPEGYRYEFINGVFMVIDLPVAPADSITLSGTLYVVEQG